MHSIGARTLCRAPKLSPPSAVLVARVTLRTCDTANVYISACEPGAEQATRSGTRTHKSGDCGRQRWPFEAVTAILSFVLADAEGYLTLGLLSDVKVPSLGWPSQANTRLCPVVARPPRLPQALPFDMDSAQDVVDVSKVGLVLSVLAHAFCA